MVDSSEHQLEYYNVLTYKTYIGKKDTYLQLYKYLRVDIYNTILARNLKNYAKYTKKHKRIARAVLVANEILWDGEAGLGVVDEIDNVQPLITDNNVFEEIERIIELEKEEKIEYGIYASRLNSSIREYISCNKISRAKMLTTRALQYMLYISSRDRKAPVLIIDNVDQASSLGASIFIAGICEIITILQEENQLPCVILARPSTISSDFFFENKEPYDHLLPHPTSVVVKRLDEMILRKSKKEIQSELNTSSRALNLYDSLIATAKAIKMILTVTNGFRNEIDNEDHNDIQYSAKNRDDIIEIYHVICSIAGKSSRSMLAVVYGMFEEMYANPNLIIETMDRRAQGKKTPIYLNYNAVMKIIFRHTTGSNYIENVFRSSKNRDSYDISKCRILKKLEDAMYVGYKVSIDEIVMSNARYGISKSETIQAIRGLRNPRRTLLWFSDSGIDDKGEYNASEMIEISARGARYYNKLLGEFEYLWYNAAKIEPTRKSKNMTIREKIDVYGSLIWNLAEIEYTQNTYRKLASEASAHRDIGDNTCGITVRIISKTLYRVMKAAYSAVMGDVKSSHRNEVEEKTYVYKCGIMESVIETLDIATNIYRLMNRVLNVSSCTHGGRFGKQVDKSIQEVKRIAEIAKKMPDISEKYYNASNNLRVTSSHLFSTLLFF